MKSMKTKYSKPIGDVNVEQIRLVEMEHSLRNAVTEVTANLDRFPLRTMCLMCGESVRSCEKFSHRKISFVQCKTCGHIQTSNVPKAEYDELVSTALGYGGIYPDTSNVDYQSRTSRVYEPKLDWILNSLENLDEVKGGRAGLLGGAWLDIGCGAGYFLNALKERGVENCVGIDVDPHNLSIARKYLGDLAVSDSDASIGEIISESDADIITAFFVFEHVPDIREVIRALAEKDKGTIVVIAVPVFSFISLFEGLVPEHYPRSLDGMVHTQIFTEKSIEYLFKSSGFEIVSEWIFGQDVADIHRFIDVGLHSNYPNSLRVEYSRKVAELIDPIQAIIDQARFSDSRHIIAIKS